MIKEKRTTKTSQRFKTEMSFGSRFVLTGCFAINYLFTKLALLILSCLDTEFASLRGARVNNTFLSLAKNTRNYCNLIAKNTYFIVFNAVGCR